MSVLCRRSGLSNLTKTCAGYIGEDLSCNDILIEICFTIRWMDQLKHLVIQIGTHVYTIRGIYLKPSFDRYFFFKDELCTWIVFNHFLGHPTR